MKRVACDVFKCRDLRFLGQGKSGGRSYVGNDEHSAFSCIEFGTRVSKGLCRPDGLGVFWMRPRTYVLGYELPPFGLGR
jgi:hypothetical protein